MLLLRPILKTRLPTLQSLRLDTNLRREDPYIKTLFLCLISLTAIMLASASFAEGYDRKDFKYRSYKPNTTIGFYTGKTCDYINIDHIVSLKDAHNSGAAYWRTSKKKIFARDKSNHVPSCGGVNRSKGSEGPSNFLRRSNDGKGLDYEIVRFCEYVQKYYEVKVKYGLSFQSNKRHPFESCGITLV